MLIILCSVYLLKKNRNVKKKNINNTINITYCILIVGVLFLNFVNMILYHLLFTLSDSIQFTISLLLVY